MTRTLRPPRLMRGRVVRLTPSQLLVLRDVVGDSAIAHVCIFGFDESQPLTAELAGARPGSTPRMLACIDGCKGIYYPLDGLNLTTPILSSTCNRSLHTLYAVSRCLCPRSRTLGEMSWEARGIPPRQSKEKVRASGDAILPL